MTRLREPLLKQKVTGSKPKARSATPAVPVRKDQYKVHMPRTPGDPDEFARFVASLNSQFGLIADRLNRIPDIKASDFVRQDDLEQLVDTLTTQIENLASSEGEETVDSTSTKSTKSSKGKGGGDEAASTAIDNARPLAAPPNVANASSIGTTTGLPTGSPRFSYEDHTHGGVLGAPVGGGSAGQIAFFTSTFQIDGDNALFWDDTNKRLGVGTNAPGTDVDVARSASGATVSGDVRNTSNTASSNARMRCQVAGSTANDPFFLFEISGVQSWAVGVDNSDSDKFKIARSSTLGTNDVVTLKTDNNIDLAGRVTTYEGIATASASKGLAPITDSVVAPVQTADIADSALANTSASGMYRISVYIQVVTTDVTAGTVQVNIKYTDETTAQTLSTTPVMLSVAGSFAQSTFFVDRNSAGITYGTTHTGIYGTSTYTVFVISERLS